MVKTIQGSLTSSMNVVYYDQKGSGFIQGVKQITDAYQKHPSSTFSES